MKQPKNQIEPRTFVTWQSADRVNTSLVYDRTISAYIDFLTRNGYKVLNMVPAFWSQALRQFVTSLAQQPLAAAQKAKGK